MTVMSFTCCLDTHMFSFPSNGLCSLPAIMHVVCFVYAVLRSHFIENVMQYVSFNECHAGVSCSSMSCKCLYCYPATVFMIAVTMTATRYDLM